MNKTTFLFRNHKKESFFRAPKIFDFRGKTRLSKEKLLVIGIILGIFFLLLIGNLNYYSRITGKVVETAVSSADVRIAEQIADEGLVSNVDVREHVDVKVKKPIFKNKVMEFNIPEGKITLEFDLLDYSKFVEKEREEEIEAEDFDIDVQETSEKYKWGYHVKLKDLNFMARIDVSSAEDIVVINNQTLKIGKNYISFADLAEQGYIVRAEQPIVLEEINISVNITEINVTNVTEINVTEINITEINITEVNVTTNVSEINIAIPENITDINITEENITIPEEDITEVETNITIPENITEINETEPEINESEEIQEAEKAEKEQIEEEVSGEQEAEQESVEQLEQEQVAEEPIEEQIEETEEELVQIIGETITGFFIRGIKGITGFFIHGIRGITGLAVQEENTVSIYIERDFNGTNYSVGDIINLDPILIIIEIIKAQHLDENRVFIKEIYNETKQKDDIWSEQINPNEYVRVRFEKNLTNENDITIYARSADNINSAKIEVYLENSEEIIALFDYILEEDWYKIYLTNLNDNESYDVFDLRILDSIVEFDYIVDPVGDNGTATDGDIVFRCGTITESGNFTMNQSIINNSLTSDCIIISTENITLDCAGYYISSDNSYTGIYSNQVNTTIENCNVSMGTSSGGYGIELDGANNSYIYNNTLNGQQYGLSLTGGTSNTRIENITANNNIYGGIDISDSSNNNTLINIIADNNGDGGIGISSSNNTLINITANNNGVGITLVSPSSNNNLTNIIGNSNTFGIYIGEDVSDTNEITGLTADSNDYGIFVITSWSNITIRDSNISNSGTYDIYFYGGEAIFLNVSYDISKASLGGWSSLTRKWYYQAYVNDTDGNALADANVTAHSSSSSQFLGTTNSSGWINQTGIIDYINDGGTRTYYTSITAVSGSSVGSQSYNGSVDENKLNDVITIDINSPNISYGDGTTANGTQLDNYIFVNVSAADATQNISTFIDIDGSLVAWWRMDDIDASNDPTDYLGVNNGTAVGNAFQREIGYLGKAFEFDGSGDYIAVSSLDEVFCDEWAAEGSCRGDNFSIAGWFKTSQTTGMQTIVGQWGQTEPAESDRYYGWQVLVESNVAVARIGWTLGTFDLTSSTSVIDGNWHHFSFVYLDNKTASLYIDGKLETSDTYASAISLAQTGQKFRIGDGSWKEDNPTLKGGPFTGTIDDIILFNRTLSADEIYGLYANKTSEYLTYNFTNPINKHTFKAYTQDLSGNVNSTEEREVTIIGVGVCGTLNMPNTVYNQTADINQTANADCIIIDETNITFDCNGYDIASSYDRTGIYSNQNYTTIGNCNISMGTGAGGIGIELSGANNSYIYNNTLNSQYNGIYIFGGLNNNITDTIISGSSGDDVYLVSSSTNNIFLNVSYSISKEYVDSTSDLSRKWHYQAHVTDNATIPNDIENGTVEAYNQTGDMLLNLTTNESGWTPIGELIDYMNVRGTRIYYSNYLTVAWENETSSRTADHYLNITDLQNVLNDSFIILEDNTVPVLSAPWYTSTTFQVWIYWTTDDVSNSSVTYWDNNNPSTIITVATNGQFSVQNPHVIYITGLSTGTNYTYNIESCSRFSGCNNRTGNEFKTASPEQGITSGGGGGITCFTNWVCDIWKPACVGAPGSLIQQTRTCRDDNACGTSSGKPEETRTCTVSSKPEKPYTEVESPTLRKGGVDCISDWQCEKWSDCKIDLSFKDISEGKVLLGGKQERICKDKNNCFFNKVEKQECDTKIPVVVKKVNRCFKDYIEIYDESGVLITRLEFIEGAYKKLNIQMLLASEYCPYCFDRQKNYDEDEVDCQYEGNNCPICIEEASVEQAYPLILIVLMILILLCSLIIVLYLYLERKGLGKRKEILRKTKRLILTPEFRKVSLEIDKKEKALFRKLRRIGGGFINWLKIKIEKRKRKKKEVKLIKKLKPRTFKIIVNILVFIILVSLSMIVYYILPDEDLVNVIDSFKGLFSISNIFSKIWVVLTVGCLILIIILIKILWKRLKIISKRKKEIREKRIIEQLLKGVSVFEDTADKVKEKSVDIYKRLLREYEKDYRRLIKLRKRIFKKHKKIIRKERKRKVSFRRKNSFERDIEEYNRVIKKLQFLKKRVDILNEQFNEKVGEDVKSELQNDINKLREKIRRLRGRR